MTSHIFNEPFRVTGTAQYLNTHQQSYSFCGCNYVQYKNITLRVYCIKKAIGLNITSPKSLLEKSLVLKGTLQVILFCSEVELECSECFPVDWCVPGLNHHVCLSGCILRGQGVDAGLCRVTGLQSGEGQHPRKSPCLDYLPLQMCSMGLLKYSEFFLKSSNDRKLIRKEGEKIIYF